MEGTPGRIERVQLIVGRQFSTEILKKELSAGSLRICIVKIR
jgi:hypothetical protein